ncbi:Protoglobin-domain-containing protein [Aspergillus varians]
MPFSDYIENIQHASRKDLYTSFAKRMAYLQAFINFTKDDIVIFNKGTKYIRAAIPSLTHRLYERMLEFDITARALRTRNTAADESVDDDYFTIDSPHVQRRKIFWKWYLTRLCSDPSQLEYWQYLEKVGTMHTGKLLIHPLTIEYIHMNACLGYLKELLFETISLNPEMSVPFKFGLIRSMSKILCIQNDLIAKGHIREGDEFLNESSTPNDLPKTESMTDERRDDSSHREVASPMPGQRSSLSLPVPSSSHSWSTSDGATTGTCDSLEHWNSAGETSISSDARSISSNPRLKPEYPEAIPTPFASPFSVEHLQTFETKIWSSSGKRKGLGS